MSSECKITEIYCMTDNFYKEFTLQQEKISSLQISCRLSRHTVFCEKICH